MAAGGLIAVLAAGLIAAIAVGGGSPRARARTAAGVRHHRPGGTRSAPASTSSSPRRAPSHAGPFAVGLRQLELVEPAAPGTADARTSSGRPARALPTTIHYPATGPAGAGERPGAPAAAGPFPLIVFSQGFNTSVTAYSGLVDDWVRAGFVVAAPVYPATDPSAPGGVNEADIVNHPRDLRFVISTLTARARSGSGWLAHLVDWRRLAVAGQSDGGDVSLAVAADNCCRDPAVKAAVILSGAEQQRFFPGHYYAAGSPPLLVAQGDADTINAPGCSAALYDQAPAPKYYLDLLGAPHLPPYIDPGPLRNYIGAAVVDFLDRYLRNRPAPLQRLRRSGGRAGLATLTTASQLAGRSTYCPPP